MYGTRSARTIDGVEYAPGKKFRVIAEGAHLSGMISEGRSAWGGWRQDLAIGDVIECTGFGPGWGGDPGYGIEFTSERARAEHANNVDFWPMAGDIFNYHPAAGYLEEVPS